jgi:hypothetical protein
MSFRLTSSGICLAVAAVVLGGLVAGNAQTGGRERGRPIEFSSPRSDEVTTNLNQLTTKKDSLKELEEDLYKPLQSFGASSSLEGVAIPPPQPPTAPTVQSKRVRELLEKRKNWVFMSPEDMLGLPTVESVLKASGVGRGDQAEKDLPPMERYYSRLSTKRTGANNPNQLKNEDLFGISRKSTSREERAAREDSELPRGVKDSAQSLSQLFERAGSDSPFARADDHSDLSDTFGLGHSVMSKEQLVEHKKFMDSYRSIIDGAFPAPAVAGQQNPLWVLPTDATAPAARPTATLPNASSLAPRTALDVQADVLNPQLGPQGLPDVNAQALGLPRSTSVLPTTEPTRVAPPVPNFAAPRRAFN